MRDWPQRYVVYLAPDVGEGPLTAYFPFKSHEDNAYNDQDGYHAFMQEDLYGWRPAAGGAETDAIHGAIYGEFPDAANDVVVFNEVFSPADLWAALEDSDWGEFETSMPGETLPSLRAETVFRAPDGPLFEEIQGAEVIRVDEENLRSSRAVCLGLACDASDAAITDGYSVGGSGEGTVSGVVYEHAKLPQLYYAGWEYVTVAGARETTCIQCEPYSGRVEASLAADRMAENQALHFNGKPTPPDAMTLSP